MTALKRTRLAVALGTGLILGTLAAGTALIVERTQQSALDHAGIALQNAALVVENAVNRQLLQVDSALASVPALLAAGGNPNGEIDPQSAMRLLRSFNFEIFIFRDILLVRPDGTVWAAARPRPRNQPFPLISPSLETASPPGAVVVEGPVRNLLTGDWILLIARPITLPGIGQLKAIAEVPVPLITLLLSPAAQIPGLRIFIERPNGVLLASLPHEETKIGTHFPPAFRNLPVDGVSVRVPPKIIRIPTIAVARHTLYPGVQIMLTLDLSRAMQDWRRDRDRLLIATMVVGLLVFALGAALFAALRQGERVETERRKAHDTLDSAIESMADGFVMWDEQDRLITCNRKYLDIYSISAPFIKLGAHFEDIIKVGAELGQYPQAGDDIDEFVHKTVEWHRGDHESLERLLPGDKWMLISERHTPTGGIVGIRTDITALKQALSDLADANERAREAIAEVELQNAVLLERDHTLGTQNMLFTAALNNMSQGLLMVDSDSRLIVCNHQFLDLFRLDATDAPAGITSDKLFRVIEDRSGLRPLAVQSLQRRQEVFAASQRSGEFISTDDDSRILAVSQCPLSDGGWVATYGDVTEQQLTQRRIQFMAHYDALTKLPNRVMFRTRLDEALTLLPQDGASLALLYLDLDKFKNVNDTLGHPAGDALLVAVALRLQGCVRSSDIVARLGGDEFAIVYRCADPQVTVHAEAQRVIDTLSAPYQLGPRRVQVGVSVGIAIPTGADMDGDTLLKNADMALYQAKAKGRGVYCVFETEMEARLNSRLAIESELRLALEREQFEVLYQPIFDLRNDCLCEFEALVRWNHPTRGVVMPGQFIPLAEELGIIKSIGAWILRQACADAAQMPADIKIAVNLSPVQLADDEIIGIVEGALTASGLDATRLELEITETALLYNGAATIAMLVRLHRLGLSIALDDFGTGYSSLSHLRSFPFNKLKIDRLFISEMATRKDCAAIVSSLVELAERLGMTTTAEGVETEEQLSLVREVSCTTVQGYLLGRPQPILVARYLDTRLEHAISLGEVTRASRGKETLKPVRNTARRHD